MGYPRQFSQVIGNKIDVLQDNNSSNFILIVDVWDFDLHKAFNIESMNE